MADWRKNFVKDRFVIMRHLKNYSVFMTFEEHSTLYGVCGITNSFKDIVPGSALSFMVKTIDLLRNHVEPIFERPGVGAIVVSFAVFAKETMVALSEKNRVRQFCKRSNLAALQR